ncbi:MAG: hypothetical protein RML38_09930 [Bacteroidia bacterium]|nr:hypothetical protein [Bacteroidia bacterium]
MGVSLALMPTRSACFGYVQNAPTLALARGTPKKSNLFFKP